MSVMLEVMEHLYKADFKNFAPTLKDMIPSYGQNLNPKQALAKKILAKTAKTLKLKA